MKKTYLLCHIMFLGGCVGLRPGWPPSTILDKISLKIQHVCQGGCSGLRLGRPLFVGQPKPGGRWDLWHLSLPRSPTPTDVICRGSHFRDVPCLQALFVLSVALCPQCIWEGESCESGDIIEIAGDMGICFAFNAGKMVYSPARTELHWLM